MCGKWEAKSTQLNARDEGEESYYEVAFVSYVPFACLLVVSQN